MLSPIRPNKGKRFRNARSSETVKRTRERKYQAVDKAKWCSLERGSHHPTGEPILKEKALEFAKTQIVLLSEPAIATAIKIDMGSMEKIYVEKRQEPISVDDWLKELPSIFFYNSTTEYVNEKILF